MHATCDPKISEQSRDGRGRWELKHLSTSRKRKQYVIPLLAESEKGIGQAESAFERKLEMWLGKPKRSRKSFLERNTSEGDSPLFKDLMVEL